MNQPINIQLWVAQVIKPTNKKMLLQGFGDQCNKQPNVPLFPDINYKCAQRQNIKHVCIFEFNFKNAGKKAQFLNDSTVTSGQTIIDKN